MKFALALTKERFGCGWANRLETKLTCDSVGIPARWEFRWDGSLGYQKPNKSQLSLGLS